MQAARPIPVRLANRPAGRPLTLRVPPAPPASAASAIGRGPPPASHRARRPRTPKEVRRRGRADRPLARGGRRPPSLPAPEPSAARPQDRLRLPAASLRPAARQDARPLPPAGARRPDQPLKRTAEARRRRSLHRLPPYRSRRPDRPRHRRTRPQEARRDPAPPAGGAAQSPRHPDRRLTRHGGLHPAAQSAARARHGVRRRG